MNSMNTGMNSKNINTGMNSKNINNQQVKKMNLKKIILIIVAILVICLIIYLIICFVNYNKAKCYKKKSFYEYMINFHNKDVCLIEKEPIPVKPVPPPKKESINILPKFEKKKEVYHIANQDYTYEQSKCKCESYGGKIATKAQVIDAYNNGANWCTYGWTDNQSAYYPVQKCDWDKMKSENERLPENKRRFCGLPGLNGGFFANPQIKFGVNCYGVKPKGSIVQAKQPYCPPMNFCKLESNYEASHKLDTDEVVGFNNDKWNMNI